MSKGELTFLGFALLIMLMLMFDKQTNDNKREHVDNSLADTVENMDSISDIDSPLVGDGVYDIRTMRYNGYKLKMRVYSDNHMELHEIIE